MMRCHGLADQQTVELLLMRSPSVLWEMTPANAARIPLSGNSAPRNFHEKKISTVPQEASSKSVTYADAGVDLRGAGQA